MSFQNVAIDLLFTVSVGGSVGGSVAVAVAASASGSGSGDGSGAAAAASSASGTGAASGIVVQPSSYHPSGNRTLPQLLILKDSFEEDHHLTSLYSNARF